MKYKLFSEDKDAVVFEANDTSEVKNRIIEHLNQNKDDVLEYTINDEINAFYQLNPSGVPCKLIIKGNKEYFKPIQ